MERGIVRIWGKYG
ncbi:hypothetical protein BDFB_012497 [Asbolus verrucosus]|uniref:Uncharacterized protein n=1 Tax=Asbolus verrucosus TaxID=1661398 RepID=A0A482V681_ASBVE|nr:hypothetical protein BDFB_012497 [Asbolus verrucosus]